MLAHGFLDELEVSGLIGGEGWAQLVARAGAAVQVTTSEMGLDEGEGGHLGCYRARGILHRVVLLHQNCLSICSEIWRRRLGEGGADSGHD